MGNVVDDGMKRKELCSVSFTEENDTVLRLFGNENLVMCDVRSAEMITTKRKRLYTWQPDCFFSIFWHILSNLNI